MLLDKVLQVLFSTKTSQNLAIIKQKKNSITLSIFSALSRLNHDVYDHSCQPNLQTWGRRRQQHCGRACRHHKQRDTQQPTIHSVQLYPARCLHQRDRPGGAPGKHPLCGYPAKDTEEAKVLDQRHFGGTGLLRRAGRHHLNPHVWVSHSSLAWVHVAQKYYVREVKTKERFRKPQYLKKKLKPNVHLNTLWRRFLYFFLLAEGTHDIFLAFKIREFSPINVFFT